MADTEKDEALREMAANRGCRLVKSRRRKPGGDYGRYGLADRKSGKQVFGFSGDGLAATAEEVEDFLRGSAASTWKSSLAASGRPAKKAMSASRTPASRAPKARASRPAPPDPAPAPAPRPKPAAEPPPRLRIRAADSVDSEAISALLAELGYEAAPDTVAERLQRLARAGEPVLIARQGDESLGCLTWHVTPNIHRPRPVGRITMMVVAEKARRRGIGRALVEAAEQRLVQRGCGLIEVTSNAKLRPAHKFYEKLGFERTSHRFAKPLSG